MKLSINLVTCNASGYLRECLGSIFTQTFKDWSLLVIDNGSNDETLERLRQIQQRGHNFKLIKNKANLGFARAHNQGVELTKSEYILMLNQDIILEPDFLENSINFMESHPRVAALTGKLLQLTETGKSDKIDSLGLKIFKNHRVVEEGLDSTDQDQANNPREIFGVSGAAPLYRRKALAEVALVDLRVGSQKAKEYFDPDFFSYKEDIDLAYRLRHAGWQAYFLPRALAYHRRTARIRFGLNDLGTLKGRQSKSLLINYHSYKNHLFFLVKNLSGINFFWYFPFIISYELKKIFYLILFEPSVLKALGEFWKLLPEMLKKRKIIMAKRKVSDSEIRKWIK